MYPRTESEGYMVRVHTTSVYPGRVHHGHVLLGHGSAASTAAGVRHEALPPWEGRTALLDLDLALLGLGLVVLDLRTRLRLVLRSNPDNQPRVTPRF